MRLIDLDSAEKIIEKEMASGIETISLVALRSWLNDRPIIDPSCLVKRGRWEKIDDSYWSWKPDGARPVTRFKYRHNECGKVVSKKENYCPACGAKMVED